MLDINAANTAALQTAAKPATPKGFKRRADAEAAATHEIGPHARRGFEFEAYKCDALWFWRTTEAKEPTAAMIKAEGGKKSLKLPIPPRRMPRATPGKAADAPEAGAAVTQPAAPEPPVTASYEDLKDGGGLRSEPVPAPDGLDIPTFLKREATPEAKAEVRKKLAKAHGPDRVIKNPPDAKTSKAKATGTAKGKTKTAMVGEMLLRKRGCTAAEAMNALGWTKISMPQHARLNGLTLRTEKDGTVTRYFGTKS